LVGEEEGSFIFAFGVENFRVELNSGLDATLPNVSNSCARRVLGAIRNVAVDNLSKSDVSVVTIEVKACCFHVCRVWSSPFQVISFENAIWCSFRLLGHRLDV
jgi:hypothetical protein